MTASIAIDGPVASGKSAVGAAVARRVGYRFIDTGLMYRAVTWLALDRKLDLNNEAALGLLAKDVELTLIPGPPNAPEASRIAIDGTDITDDLRSPQVGESVSLVSRVPGVRNAMVALQRRLAADEPTVMVGRDIGTVVLPDANPKVFLDASAEERARRRYEELVGGGKKVTLDEVHEELALRDRIDSGRDVSPLKPAADAIILHTDDLSLEQVVERVTELVECRS